MNEYNYYDTYRLIYSYYVMDDITDIHKYHMLMLSKFIYIFNYIDFYLLCNDINNNELINKHIQYIKSILNKDNINFIIIQNDSELREGQIYKKYIIDKLNDYNELIFFAHIKGITNLNNLNNKDNTYLWIALMYYFNLNYYKQMAEDFLYNKSLSWGTIYNYDENNITKYHWQYTGSFHWINCKELYNYIKDNNIDLSIYEVKQKMRTCAEEFLGETFDPKYAAFLNHKRYNKYFSHFLYENSSLPYYNINWVGFELIDIDSYNNFLNFIKNI